MEGQALWLGEEMEGPWYGKWTLFVKGAVPLETIVKAIANHPSPIVEHVYFGAGRCADINWGAVHELLNEGLVFVTVELRGALRMLDLSVRMLHDKAKGKLRIVRCVEVTDLVGVKVEIPRADAVVCYDIKNNSLVKDRANFDFKGITYPQDKIVYKGGKHVHD